MNKNFIRFYLFSLFMLLLVSIYPIYMGAIKVSSYLQKGFIDVKDYQRYIIPYTTICLALFVIAKLMHPMIREKSLTVQLVSLMDYAYLFAL